MRIAVDRYGKRFLDCVLGSRAAVTGKKLWQSINRFLDGHAITDHWQSYQEFIPRAQHLQSKSQTYTVEGYNSLFRHFLARLRRKTKCYSKSKQMLELSVRLLMAQWNKQILY
jgi:insertion element IS1 protein InsB